MFDKLRKKYITTIMILLISILLIVCAVIFYSTRKNNENILFSQMNFIINNFDAPKRDAFDISDNLEGVLINCGESEIRFTNSYGLNKEDIKMLLSIINSSGNKRNEGFITYNKTKYAFVCKKKPLGEVIYLKSSKDYDEANSRLIGIFIFIILGSIIIFYFVSKYIAKNAIKPVEEAYNEQSRFIADASHELKTPLAIIKTNLEVLSNNKQDTIENQSKWFEYINFQTSRMSNLVNDLLYLAKSDNKEILGANERYNLSNAIMNQVLSFEAIMFEKDIILDLNIEDNIVFNGNKEAIEQLVGILIDNAIKYSYKKGVISVSLIKEKQKIIFKVTNNGDTIEKEDLDKLFNRFYRVDKSRDRKTGSYGLGLSIAKSIVEKHNGNIYAESKDNMITFIVEFN